MTRDELIRRLGVLAASCQGDFDEVAAILYLLNSMICTHTESIMFETNRGVLEEQRKLISTVLANRAKAGDN